MTRFASRTDVHYISAFVAGLVALYASGSVMGLLLSFVTQPATQSYTQLQSLDQAVNVAGMVGATLGYAGLFWVFAWALKQFAGAQVRSSGVWAGAAAAGLLMVGLLLVNTNSALFVSHDTQPWLDASVWVDLVSILTIGFIYMFAWLLAIHLGRPNSSRSKERKSA